MNDLRSFRLSTEEIEILRGRLLNLPSVTPIRSEPRFAATIAALGIQQEVGTLNDELSRFVYDADVGQVVSRNDLRAELIEYRGFVGVRIWAEKHARLELRLKGLRELLHPTFSFNPDGTVKQLVFFPMSLAKIAALQGIELVIVREWALNTIFGGFDRTRLFYETNVWELVHNDSLRYSELLEHRQIALLGTHDVSAHIAGALGTAMNDLQKLGAETRRRFKNYFGESKRHSVYSLVLPYAAGVLLDDLAQPQNYGSLGREFVLGKLLEILDSGVISASDPRHLFRFPDAYEKIIQIARHSDFNRVQLEAADLCVKLVEELQSFSFSKIAS